MNDLKQRFFKNDKLIKIPKKEIDKIELFKYVYKFFDPLKAYTETEVNDILKNIYPDYAVLRRYLVDYKFLERTASGSEYKAVEKLL